MSGFIKTVAKELKSRPKRAGFFFLSKVDDIKIKGKSVFFSFLFPFIFLPLLSFLYFLLADLA